LTFHPVRCLSLSGGVSVVVNTCLLSVEEKCRECNRGPDHEPPIHIQLLSI